MSQPLAPRPTPGGEDSSPPAAPKRPSKISTACGACKQRKTKCSGGRPCDACATRSSACVYDASSDQRRKIANQRNVADLAEAHHDLERYRQLVGGLVAIIRAGDATANMDLVRLVRGGIDLPQLAAHVRNECRSNFPIQQAYDSINFVIDGPEELPSPAQILNRMQSVRPPSSDHSHSSEDLNRPPTDSGASR